MASARVQRGPTETARCTSTGDQRAPVPFSVPRAGGCPFHVSKDLAEDGLARDSGYDGYIEDVLLVGDQ